MPSSNMALRCGVVGNTMLAIIILPIITRGYTSFLRMKNYFSGVVNTDPQKKNFLGP